MGNTNESLLFRLVVGFLIIVFSVPLGLLSALPVMLAMGVLHASWHQVPAWGFWSVFLVVWAFKAIVPYQTKIDEKKKPA